MVFRAEGVGSESRVRERVERRVVRWRRVLARDGSVAGLCWGYAGFLSVCGGVGGCTFSRMSFSCSSNFFSSSLGVGSRSVREAYWE